jgi:hypothetical protein
VSDMWDYAEQAAQDAAEEEAYYREKDREIEAAQAREAFLLDGGSCSRCGRDGHLPGSMGGCYCL